MIGLLIVIYVLVFIFFGNAITGAILAEAKGRSVVGWFFLCLLMPFTGLILIVGLPSENKTTHYNPQTKLDKQFQRGLGLK